MMLGGGMMLGLGLLMMLLVLGLPVLLIVAVVAGLWALLGRRPTVSGPAVSAAAGAPPAPAPARFCPHCGQGLQADWTHCPRCGSPVAQ